MCVDTSTTHPASFLPPGSRQHARAGLPSGTGVEPVGIPMPMTSAPRVLLIDDDAFAFRVVKTLLDDAKSPISLEWVDSYEKGLGRLMSGGTDVCLLDFQLGDRSG